MRRIYDYNIIIKQDLRYNINIKPDLRYSNASEGWNIIWAGGKHAVIKLKHILGRVYFELTRVYSREIKSLSESIFYYNLPVFGSLWSATRLVYNAWLAS